MPIDDSEWRDRDDVEWSFRIMWGDWSIPLGVSVSEFPSFTSVSVGPLHISRFDWPRFNKKTNDIYGRLFSNPGAEGEVNDIR